MKFPLSLSQKIWQFSSKKIISDLSELQSLLLKSRGLTRHKDIQNFLEPSLKNLISPWKMKDMKKAVERISQSIEKKERIVIFGDFDTDGITATIILVHALRTLGAQVSYRIPERNTDSHGLKTHLLDEIALRKVKLVITVDCGINDTKEIASATEKGIDIIVTDHHEPRKESFPKKAIAVINPKLEENGNTSPNLSGSAVAWKLAAALLEQNIKDKSSLAKALNPLLEIAAIGIIADCVPLVGENRILAKFGLEKIKKTPWEGLLTLLKETNTSLKKIDEDTVGFVIAPHLNAASRLGDVLIATQLFLGDKEGNSSRVIRLRAWNSSRRVLTENAVAEAQKQVRPDAPFQIFYNKSWKPGILGLLAARYSQQLGVPVIACTKRTDEKIAASCRAPAPYSIIHGLESSESLLERFGGHAGAAGFLIQESNIEKLTQSLDKHFSSLNIGPLPQRIDTWISPKLLNWELLDFLKFFAPFGNGNPLPVFGIGNVKITNICSMGAQKNHVRFEGDVEGERLEFVAFFSGHLLRQLRIGDLVDIAFTLGENEWNGEQQLQFRVEDVRKNSDFTKKY